MSALGLLVVCRLLSFPERKRKGVGDPYLKWPFWDCTLLKGTESFNHIGTESLFHLDVVAFIF